MGVLLPHETNVISKMSTWLLKRKKKIKTVVTTKESSLL